MAELIRHSRAVSPYFYPNKGGDPSNLHGITDIGGGASVDSTEEFVVGKRDKCGTDVSLPSSSVPITQNERGEIATYLTLANLDAEPGGGIELDDFSSALIDVAIYERDSFNGTIEKTTWFPKTAIASLSLNIADPESKIERSFELQGDNELNLQYDNKILIHKEFVAGTGDAGTGGFVLDCSDPIPEADPNRSGKFILRVDRTRSGETTTLDEDAGDFSYDSGTQDITIEDETEIGDVINVYYSSDSFGGPGDPTTVDSADPCFLKATNVTVLLSDGITEIELDTLTSLTIDATINRADEGVIGKDEKVVREISDTPVTVSLSGRIKRATIAEAFMGQLGNNWGITDVKRFLSNVRVTVKIYSDVDKTNFLLGYQVDDLAFNDDSFDYTANDFGTLDTTASSSSLLITAVEGNL